MRIGKLFVAVGLALALGAGLVQAKIPVAPMDDAARAKAEEAKAKSAEAGKKEAELLAKAQDRVAERYKKGQGKTAPADKGAAKPAAKK